MAAFSSNKYWALAGALKRTKETMRAAYTNDFTHSEILSLFVPPDDLDVLTRARGVAQVYNAGMGFTAKVWAEPQIEVTIGVSLMGDPEKLPLAPKYPALQKDAPQELHDKLTSWVTEQVELDLCFARALKVFDRLNDLCTSPRQIRFFWPSIVPLCREAELTADAERLEVHKAPGSVPQLPPELRAACQSTSGVIAAAQLLKNNKVIPTPVLLQLDQRSERYEPGLGSI